MFIEQTSRHLLHNIFVSSYSVFSGWPHYAERVGDLRVCQRYLFSLKLLWFESWHRWWYWTQFPRDWNCSQTNFTFFASQQFNHIFFYVKWQCGRGWNTCLSRKCPLTMVLDIPKLYYKCVRQQTEWYGYISVKFYNKKYWK